MQGGKNVSTIFFIHGLYKEKTASENDPQINFFHFPIQTIMSGTDGKSKCFYQNQGKCCLRPKYIPKNFWDILVNSILRYRHLKENIFSVFPQLRN